MLYLIIISITFQMYIYSLDISWRHPFENMTCWIHFIRKKWFQDIIHLRFSDYRDKSDGDCGILHKCIFLCYSNYPINHYLTWPSHVTSHLSNAKQSEEKISRPAAAADTDKCHAGRPELQVQGGLPWILVVVHKGRYHWFVFSLVFYPFSCMFRPSTRWRRSGSAWSWAGRRSCCRRMRSSRWTSATTQRCQSRHCTRSSQTDQKS